MYKNKHTLRTKSIQLKLLTYITRDCGASGYAVYSVLLCHACTKGDDIGKSFPGIELMAQEANLSEKTVRTAVKLLKKHRYILVHKRKSANGYYNNVYWIAWIRNRNWRWGLNEEVNDNGTRNDREWSTSV